MQLQLPRTRIQQTRLRAWAPESRRLRRLRRSRRPSRRSAQVQHKFSTSWARAQLFSDWLRLCGNRARLAHGLERTSPLLARG